jgi:hypothetical protein
MFFCLFFCAMDSTAATRWQWDGRSSGAAMAGIVVAALAA